MPVRTWSQIDMYLQIHLLRSATTRDPRQCLAGCCACVCFQLVSAVRGLRVTGCIPHNSAIIAPLRDGWPPSSGRRVSSESSQRALVYLPVLHDQVEVLLRRGDERQVLQRIAVDQNQFRVGPRFNNAQRAIRVRVSRTIVKPRSKTSLFAIAASRV